jgi:hypothetical protein
MLLFSTLALRCISTPSTIARQLRPLTRLLQDRLTAFMNAGLHAPLAGTVNVKKAA